MQTLRSEVFGPVFAENEGEVVKRKGDRWLIEFSSSVAAVNAAMQVKGSLRGHATTSLRMGIHIGDVTRSESELFGDAINIAARLEGMSPQGGTSGPDSHKRHWTVLRNQCFWVNSDRFW